MARGSNSTTVPLPFASVPVSLLGGCDSQPLWLLIPAQSPTLHKLPGWLTPLVPHTGSSIPIIENEQGCARPPYRFPSLSMWGTTAAMGPKSAFDGTCTVSNTNLMSLQYSLSTRLLIMSYWESLLVHFRKARLGGHSTCRYGKELRNIRTSHDGTKSSYKWHLIK